MATWAAQLHWPGAATGTAAGGVAWSAKVAAVSCIADKDELSCSGSRIRSRSPNWSRSRRRSQAV